MLQEQDFRTAVTCTPEWKRYRDSRCFECRIGIVSEPGGDFSTFAIDLPGVASFGDTVDAAVANIRDALHGALMEYCDSGRIPWTDEEIDEGVEVRRILVALPDALLTE